MNRKTVRILIFTLVAVITVIGALSLIPKGIEKIRKNIPDIQHHELRAANLYGDRIYDTDTDNMIGLEEIYAGMIKDNGLATVTMIFDINTINRYHDDGMEAIYNLTTNPEDYPEFCINVMTRNIGDELYKRTVVTNEDVRIYNNDGKMFITFDADITPDTIKSFTIIANDSPLKISIENRFISFTDVMVDLEIEYKQFYSVFTHEWDEMSTIDHRCGNPDCK